MDSYDLVVIGTGPAGHFGAIQAAKLGKRVAAIEAHPQLGGACAITGTIPSKALREATMHLTGLRQRTHYGMNYRVKDDLTVEDLTMSTGQIIRHEVSVLEAQLRRNGVELITGDAAFTGSHEIRVQRRDVTRDLRAERVLIASGSQPAHPPGMDFDGERIIDSNQILHLDTLPRSLIVVGAGVIGVEYACIFAALGVRVTLVNQREDFLEFIDREIVETLKYHMQSRNVDFRLGEEVTSVDRMRNFVVATTKSNKKLAAECLLYSVGRQGNTGTLGLEKAGVEVDARGRVQVDARFRTAVSHIYAAGDVVGFPALAATAREQGRRAICHAFGVDAAEPTSKMPFGIYAIPEISMIGPTEKELTEKRVPYEIGRARYREIARGQILGDIDGMLKILFERDTRRVLAVHIIGDGATELIHIGQAAEAFGATLDYFANTVFNYPTLAECYKVAALDGINRVRLLNGIIENEGDVSDELQSVADRTAPLTGIEAPEPAVRRPVPEARHEPEPEARHEPKPEPRPGPEAREEPRPEPKPEPKPEARHEPKPEPKRHIKPEPEPARDALAETARMRRPHVIPTVDRATAERMEEIEIPRDDERQVPASGAGSGAESDAESLTSSHRPRAYPEPEIIMPEVVQTRREPRAEEAGERFEGLPLEVPSSRSRGHQPVSGIETHSEAFRSLQLPPAPHESPARERRDEEKAPPEEHGGEEPRGLAGSLEMLRPRGLEALLRRRSRDDASADEDDEDERST